MEANINAVIDVVVTVINGFAFAVALVLVVKLFWDISSELWKLRRNRKRRIDFNAPLQVADRARRSPETPV
jgi:hypothetical protein